MPVAVTGVEKLNGTDLNDTKLDVIQSPSASACPVAITLPVASSILMGKEASKYQVPRALPVTTSGLRIVAFGRGTSMMTFCEVKGVTAVEGDEAGDPEIEVEGEADVLTDGDGVGASGSSALKYKYSPSAAKATIISVSVEAVFVIYLY